ncbi:MAG: hypothetical protein QM662_04920 [Gordonia sp. (in: high G+C Gram-positive bacteria)]
MRNLIATAEVATDIWGVAWARTMARAVVLANGGTPVDGLSTILPIWRAPQHQSRAAQADAGVKQLGAVPWLAETTVGLELAGLTDDQITRALAERELVAAQKSLTDLLAAPETDTEAGAVDETADEAGEAGDAAPAE